MRDKVPLDMQRPIGIALLAFAALVAAYMAYDILPREYRNWRVRKLLKRNKLRREHHRRFKQ